MLTNNNIDFPTLRSAPVAEIIPTKLIIWLYAAVLLQPLLYSLNFWLISHSIPTAFMGFMLGSFAIIIWMLYDCGFFKIVSKYINKSKFYKDCGHKACSYFDSLESTSRLFWLFAAPALPIIGLFIYTISYIVLFIAALP